MSLEHHLKLQELGRTLARVGHNVEALEPALETIAALQSENTTLKNQLMVAVEAIKKHREYIRKIRQDVELLHLDDPESLPDVIEKRVHEILSNTAVLDYTERVAQTRAKELKRQGAEEERQRIEQELTTKRQPKPINGERRYWDMVLWADVRETLSQPKEEG